MYNIFFSTKRDTSLWIHLAGLIGIMFIGALIGQFIIKNWLAMPENILQPKQELNLDYRNFLLISQTIMATSIFIVAPLLYLYSSDRKFLRYFFAGEQRYGRFVILTFALILAAMIVNTLFIHWNMQLKLPVYLKNFEKWAQYKEAELKRLTDLLTHFTSFQDLFIAILIIGILPAIGEELIFRGILQNLFFKSTKNMSIAICISAFIFSAIHLQLYGFLPRSLLGVLFGYLYSWTKNLAFPMVAHFFHNSIALTLSFFHQKNATGYELEGNRLLPAPALMIFVIISIFLIRYIQKNTQYLHG